MQTRTILIAALILFSTACAKERDAPATDATAEATVRKAPAEVGGGEADGTSAVSANKGGSARPATERMIIRNADLTIVVASPDQTTPEITGIAQTLGGFIVNASSYGSGATMNTDLTIRVPADGFEQALERFRALGEVSSETISGQDVTEEFVDLQARLKVQRNLEERFLNLLATAETIEDTLAVERELSRVRQEIETMEGRSKYLRDQSTMATIRLHMRAESVTQEPAFGEIGEAFSDSGDIIVTVVAGAIRVVAALLPIALMLLVFGFVVIRVFSAIRDRRRA